MNITVSYPRTRSNGSVYENGILHDLEILHSSFSSLISSLAILHGLNSVFIDEITNECTVIHFDSDCIGSEILLSHIEKLFELIHTSLPEFLISSIKVTKSRKFFNYSVFTISLNY